MMSEFAQQLVALGVVATAIGYLAVRAWRKAAAARNAKAGCASDCGCGE